MRCWIPVPIATLVLSSAAMAAAQPAPAPPASEAPAAPQTAPAAGTMPETVAPPIAPAPAVASPPTVVSEPEPEPGTEPEVKEAGPSYYARMQIFYDWEDRFSDDESFNRFELKRGEIGGGFKWGDLGGFYLNFESVRSAGSDPDSGVRGNSIVLRAKHAFAHTNPEVGPGKLRLEAGLIRDIWIQTLEKGFELRAHNATSSDRTKLFTSSDLGLTVGYSLMSDLVVLTYSLMNGEGRAESEQNRGKNSTVILSSFPYKFRMLNGDAKPAVHVGARDGSLGESRDRAHRIFGGVTFVHPRLGGGFEYVRAYGTAGNPAGQGRLFSAWVRGEPIERWLGAFARFEDFDADVEADFDGGKLLEGGVYSNLLQHGKSRIRVYLAGELKMPERDPAADPATEPPADEQAVRLIFEAAGLFESD